MERTTLFLFLLFLIQRASGQSGPVVETQNGPVQGVYNYTLWESKQFSMFLGIPYALAPIGLLRFKPPVPAQRWNGTLDATQHGSICPQLVVETQELQGDENCLTLNVYTPDTNFTGPLVLKPVLVWIHGGGYRFGHSNHTLYGTDFLVRHDVVVVTFNYRLGPFGFLALDHPDALGNAGLKDQYLVLQWVQKNIAAFGGDPNQVTIFGESAGAASVGFHVLADQAKGLFSKAIYLSGVPLCPWGHHSAVEAHKNAYDLALILGHVPTSTNDLLNFLLNASTMSLLNGSLILVVVNNINLLLYDFSASTYI
ncbi:Esterase B1 [Anthophora retusa]